MPGFGANGVLSDEAHSFLDQISDDSSEEERATLGDNLIAAAREFWTWSAKKPAQEQRVRLLPGDQTDVLEVVGPDMPFLVRSVMAELAEQASRLWRCFTRSSWRRATPRACAAKARRCASLTSKSTSNRSCPSTGKRCSRRRAHIARRATGGR
ncbi:MAG: hypothetical protein WDN76_03635 [Alphaproteobacteria bacterium]